MAKKPNPKTSLLVTASSIARDLGTSNTNVEGVIRRGKLKPESTVPYAGGLMRLYLRSALQPLVQAYIDDRAAKANPPAPEPAAAAPTCATSDPCLAELAKHLAINDATLEGMRETQATLQQQVGLLLQQNRELFGVLKAVQGDTSALASGLIGAGAA